MTGLQALHKECAAAPRPTSFRKRRSAWGVGPSGRPEQGSLQASAGRGRDGSHELIHAVSRVTTGRFSSGSCGCTCASAAAWHLHRAERGRASTHCHLAGLPSLPPPLGLVWFHLGWSLQPPLPPTHNSRRHDSDLTPGRTELIQSRHHGFLRGAERAHTWMCVRKRLMQARLLQRLVISDSPGVSHVQR